MRSARAIAVPLALFALFALAPHASRAQGIPGLDQGPPSSSSVDLGAPSQGAAAQQFGSGAARAAPLAPSTTSSADALLGLEHVDAPPLLGLDAALARAAERSYDLRIAREKVVQQEAQVRRAWSYLLPQVGLSGGYTLNCTFLGGSFADCADQTVQFTSERQIDQQATLFESIGDLIARSAEFESDPVEREKAIEQAETLHQAARDLRGTDVSPVVVQPAHVVNGGLSVSVPLFNGRALPLLQNAMAGVDAVKAASSQARAALLYGVARGYYAAVAGKKLVAIAERQVETAARHREATQKRVDASALAPLALKRAQLDEVRARQQLRAAEHAYRLALGAVGELIGQRTIFAVEDPPPQRPIEQGATAEALIEAAWAGRPEVRASRLALEIAERGRLDAWMMFLPSLSLVGQARATSAVNGFVNAPLNGAVSVQLTLPLYDGGARYAALQESSSRIREELLKVRQLEQRIEAQVRGNLADIAVKQEALLLAREARDVARESLAQAEAMYQAGVGTSLDVSDTNLALFSAEVDVARAELDLEQARLGLAYVTGAFPGRAEALGQPLTADEERDARARLSEAP